MFEGNCNRNEIRKERLDFDTTRKLTKEEIAYRETARAMIEEYTRNHSEKPTGIYCGVLPISKIKVNKLNWESHEE